jgi:hypothetical protein
MGGGGIEEGLRVVKMRGWDWKASNVIEYNNDNRRLGRIRNYAAYLTTNLLIDIVGFSLLSMAFPLSPCVVIGFNFDTNERKTEKICFGFLVIRCWLLIVSVGSRSLFLLTVPSSDPYNDDKKAGILTAYVLNYN